MRCYEVIFLISPDISGEEAANRMKDFADKMVNVGCEIIKCNSDLVAQKLAYPIKKRDKGYFYVFHVKIAEGAAKNLVKLYGDYIDHNAIVLRSMLYKVDAHSEDTMIPVATMHKVQAFGGNNSYGETAGAVLVNTELVPPVA